MNPPVDPMARPATDTDPGVSPFDLVPSPYEPVVSCTAVRVSLVGSFIILLVGAVYLAKGILLPIALAFMLTLP